ncbi:putative protein kinase [Leptomonas seymouri]|uniref:PH domain-containing protein n=1 Tax=Leptomonas seymouri TaxID=5684 RepID=A0A0N1PCC9_LEPSE|nr:putative protein kinase [Leptomonas seymouri]|eukprot:KPI86835.1 putative protein kinase [Leptomonas seymouri]
MSAPAPSPMMDRGEPGLCAGSTRQDLPSTPQAAWMWKPRSKLVNSNGSAKQATSLLQLRSIGSKHWNRRFVFIDHHFFCYGKKKGRKDKQVPFELVEAVRREAADKLRREHAPKEFADFGWYLAVKGRTLLFCAESEESAVQWVSYLEALLQVMKGSPAGPLPGTASLLASAAAFSDATPEMLTPARDATLAELGVQYGAEHLNDSTHYDTLTTVTSPGEWLADGANRQTPGEHSRRQQSTLAVSPAPQSSNLMAASPEGGAEPQQAHKHDEASDVASEAGSGECSSSSQASAALVGRAATQGSRDNANGDDGDSGAEMDNDMSDDRSNDPHGGAYLLGVSSDDTEGDDSGDDDREDSGDDGEEHSRARTTGSTKPRSAVAKDETLPEHSMAECQLPREVRYARLLLLLAADPHSHISYRIPALESYFKSGDDMNSVTFSRTVEKLGKRDNAQTREVVLTARHLYLFSSGRLANSHQMRCIDTRDITGVVESTADKAAIAILIPTFHDLLLKVVPQNSCVPGTLAEVKQQLIAHLYKAHCDAHTDHRFLLRESATVPKEIRRTREALYPPLIAHAGDQMRVGEKAILLETFAKNADVAVYWSSMVRQVQADRKPRLCALVVTEGSIYSLSDTLQEVVRRTYMWDLLYVEYDADAQSILLKCRGVDVLFSMQSSTEFDGFLQVLPTAMADGFGRTLRLTPSKQLYSHAKLFSLSTLNSAGPARATRSALRRHYGFPWPKGKKAGSGTKLFSSFAAAADEEADDGAAAGEAFHQTIQGDYRNSQAIRMFCAQFRFVEEILLDYDDAVILWEQYEASAGLPCWDSLRLRNTFTTRLRVGEICLSAPCRLLDAKECATLAKSSAQDLHESVVMAMGTPRAICVTSEGILFLRSGAVSTAAAAAAGSSTSTLSGSAAAGLEPGSADAALAVLSPDVRIKVKRRLSGAVSHISSGAGKDDDLVLGLVGWSSIAAVVRCHSKEGSSVALLTNRAHPVDYLFHLASAQTMLDVMAAAMGCYAQYQHGNPDHTHFPPLYAAPRAQNLAVAMKKTVFDPFPTVALRYTPYSFPSDRLRMAFIPDVADACRRFGDNTIHFSGMAWRVRSATLRKYGGRLEEDPGAGMRRHNNHLYKSYIFVLTNVAIYHCTKGGFEMVRRTLLTDIKGITVGLHDPDTVLLSVPSEYDMYFRIEGRGAEVIARLQEAYVEWTNYNHYLPYERQGSHTLEEYGLPVRQAPCVAALGTLTKPAHFNDLQSSRPASECRHQMQQWHLRCLRRAIAGFERAQAAARKDHRSAPSAKPGALQLPMWNRVSAALAERSSFLYFVQRRCFRFGLTSEDFEEMQRAQRLLRSYREMEAGAIALITATSSTDPEVFQAALQRASTVPDLRLLVEEETRVYESYLARRACLTAIFDAVSCYRYQPNGKSTSLVALEATLLDLLQEASRMGFDASFLRYVVHVVRVLVHRTQIQRVVCDPANQRRLLAAHNGGWALVRQAAGEVGMTWRPPVSATAARSPSTRLQLNARAAHLALKHSTNTGEPALIRGAMALAVSVLEASEQDGAKPSAKECDAAAFTALRRALAALQDALTPTKEEERQHLLRAVEALIAARQAHQRQQTWTPNLVSDLLATCMRLEEQVATQRCPLLHNSTQSVLAMEHAMLTEQQHRLCLRRALEKRELKAQQQRWRELQKQQLALQRAVVRRQQREATARERRQRKALTLWSNQVDQLVSKLDAVLADATGVPDERIRLGVKRCVHLQRWIAEAAERYKIRAPTSAADAQHKVSPLLSALHRSPAGPPLDAGKVSNVLAELLTKLQSAAARAQNLLDKRARGESSPYGETDKGVSHTIVCPPLSDATDGDAEGGAGAVAFALPTEVGKLIAALDTKGLVAYIQHHQESTAASAMLDQIRLHWRRARCRQRWVKALHRHLHAAAVLHSRELLETALHQAEEAQYTDAAVETARRAVEAMRAPQPQRQPQGEGKDSSVDAAPSPTPSPPSPSSRFVDPWRQRRHVPPTEDVEDARGEGSAAAVRPVLRATEEEEPIARADATGIFQEGSNSAANTNKGPTEAKGHAHPNTPKLKEVMLAMEGVARAAERDTAALPNANAVLQQLCAATAALVERAVSAASDPRPEALSSTSGETDPATADKVCITADNPFCAPFLQAWRATLQHQVRPSGRVMKEPRTVWDVVRGIGEANTNGEYVAPYVTRLSSDFQRLYRSTEDSDSARQRTDAVLLALIFFSHRMECVWNGLLLLDEKGRRELLLQDSLMAQPEVVQALLGAARVCDALQWAFPNVQALAMECLFPRSGAVEVPMRHRSSRNAAAALHSHTSQAAEAKGVSPTRRVSPPPEAPQAQLPPSRGNAPPRRLAVSPSALETPVAEASTVPIAAMREVYCGQVMSCLQESVRDIASYFTRQLRTHGPAPGESPTAAIYFDEHSYPEVGELVETSVLPALLALLTGGLARRGRLTRTHTLWDLLTALKETLTTSSRTLATAEVLSVMNMVEALTDTSGMHGRYNAKLRSFSNEELGELRVRIALRECMNRMQLHPLICAIFPLLSGNEAWIGEDSGVLWSFYHNPALCLLHPRDAESSVQLRPLLERLSALPFVLVVDRELR